MKDSVNMLVLLTHQLLPIQQWDHTTSLVMMTIMVKMRMVMMVMVVMMQCSSPMPRPRVGVATAHSSIMKIRTC